jgi:hypothetical protein
LESERHIADKVTTEQRLFIPSLKAGAHNFSTLRRMTFSVLKREPTHISIRKNRIRAG